MGRKAVDQEVYSLGSKIEEKVTRYRYVVRKADGEEETFRQINSPYCRDGCFRHPDGKMYHYPGPPCVLLRTEQYTGTKTSEEWQKVKNRENYLGERTVVMEAKVGRALHDGD